MPDHLAALAALSRAVRDSTLKRLRLVPVEFANWRPDDLAMSFADIAFHLIAADRWLFQKVAEPSLPPITGAAGAVRVESPDDWRALIGDLADMGDRRVAWIRSLTEAQLDRILPDERFGGDISVWWLLVRGNLDHETHHRGQVGVYLRLIRRA